MEAYTSSSSKEQSISSLHIWGDDQVAADQMSIPRPPGTAYHRSPIWRLAKSVLGVTTSRTTPEKGIAKELIEFRSEIEYLHCARSIVDVHCASENVSI